MRILTGLYKFTKLPLREQWLTFRIYYLAIIISILIEIFPFRWFAIKLGRQMEETSYELSEKEAIYSLRVGSLVAHVCRHTPWTIKCLTQSIVTKKLLNQKRIETTLYLGVKKSDNKLEAHAWIRAGSKIVNGAHSHKQFTIVSCFGKKPNKKPARDTPEVTLP